MKPETCGRCGEEIRWGERHGRMAWWHREDVDHHVIHGTPSEPVPWIPEPAEPEEEHHANVIPDPELRAIRLKHQRQFIGLPTGEVILAEVPQGARTIINLARKHGWEVQEPSFARGSIMHASQDRVVRVSDLLLVRARLTTLDSPTRIAVASWRDGKFDYAYIGRRPPHVDRASNKALKAFLKGELLDEDA